ncbi:TPA: hypothetical protein ACH3X3_001289 [Trebouxia sp. C0006]
MSVLPLSTMMIEAAGLKARRNFTVLLLTTDNTNTYRIHTTKTTRTGVLRNIDRGLPTPRTPSLDLPERHQY